MSNFPELNELRTSVFRWLTEINQQLWLRSILSIYLAVRIVRMMRIF